MAKISPLMLLPPVVFAAFGAMAFWGMSREDPSQLPSTFVGRAAPPVQITPFAGQPGFGDADLRDGKVKLVNFWASWCGPCRVEHPNLQALAAEGLPVYGVNYKDTPAQAEGFLAELGSPYAAIGVDAKGRMAVDWGVYGVPETFVVDGEGKVLFRFAGPVTQRVIDAQLRPILAEAGSPAPAEAGSAAP